MDNGWIYRRIDEWLDEWMTDILVGGNGQIHDGQIYVCMNEQIDGSVYAQMGEIMQAQEGVCMNEPIHAWVDGRWGMSGWVG